MVSKSMCAIFGANKSTMCSAYNRAIAALRVAICELPLCIPRYPTAAEADEMFEAIQKRHGVAPIDVPNVAVYLDGTNTDIKKSSNEKDQANNTSGNKGTTLAHQIVFCTFGWICDIDLNNPGTVNDSRAAIDLFKRFWDPLVNPAQAGMLADTAYRAYADACTVPEAWARIKAGVYRPLSATDLPGLPPLYANLILAMSAWIVSARQADEWGNRALYAAFPRITIARQFVHAHLAREDMQTVIWLFNLRVKTVGYNQLATTYRALVDDRYARLLACRTVDDYVRLAEQMVSESMDGSL